MICQTNYFISTSSPKLRIFCAGYAGYVCVCVFLKTTLCIFLRIQSKAQHCGCISPSFCCSVLLTLLPVGEHFYCTLLSSILRAEYHSVLFLPLTALTSEITISSKVIWVLPELLRAHDDMDLIVRRVGWWHWNTDGACLFEIFSFKLPSPGQSSLPVSQHPASPTETRLFHTGKSGPVNWQSGLGSAHTPSTPPPPLPPLNRHKSLPPHVDAFWSPSMNGVNSIFLHNSDWTEGTRKCGNNLHFLTVLPSETIINHDRKNVEAILAGETCSACEQPWHL